MLLNAYSTTVGNTEFLNRHLVWGCSHWSMMSPVLVNHHNDVKDVTGTARGTTYSTLHRALSVFKSH